MEAKAAKAPPPPSSLPKAKKAPGQPRSPWRVRVEQRQAAEKTAAEQSVLQQVERAILAGKAPELLEQLIGITARQSFSAFCRAAWHVIEPSTHLEWGKHHELICTTLQAIFEEWYITKSDQNYLPAVRNTVINTPPGSLKSKLISVMFQAWVWLKCPGARFICVSINDQAAWRDARDVLKLLNSAWYQSTFKPEWSLNADQAAISDFGNTDGGGRLSRPSGAAIIGLRGDFFIGDDLNDPQKTDNKTERDSVNTIWETNQYNRVNNLAKSQRICVQQRVHSMDHTGWVISRQGTWSPNNDEGWMHLVLPAEFELSRSGFALPECLARHVKNLPNAVLKDWRTQEGELLHPAMLSAKTLAEFKKLWAGTSNYAGQMQQRPTKEGGGAFQRAYFGFFRLAGGVRDDIDGKFNGRPRPFGCHEGKAEVIGGTTHQPGRFGFEQIVLSIDPALKKTDIGSLWGMLAIGYIGAQRYILDDRSQRGGPEEAEKVIIDMIRYWKPDRLLIEEKAGGPALATNLKIAMSDNKVPMTTIEMYNPGIPDKTARSNLCIPTFANGNVYLLDGAPWLEALVDEVSGYPNYTTDDRLDCIVQSILHGRDFGYQLPTAEQFAACTF